MRAPGGVPGASQATTTPMPATAASVRHDGSTAGAGLAVRGSWPQLLMPGSMRHSHTRSRGLRCVSLTTSCHRIAGVSSSRSSRRPAPQLQPAPAAAHPRLPAAAPRSSNTSSEPRLHGRGSVQAVAGASNDDSSSGSSYDGPELWQPLPPTPGLGRKRKVALLVAAAMLEISVTGACVAAARARGHGARPCSASAS
jgi:hypothetical protein